MKEHTGRSSRIDDAAWRDNQGAVRATRSHYRDRRPLWIVVLAAVSIAALAPWRMLACNLPVHERAVLLLQVLAVASGPRKRSWPLQ